MIFAKTVIACAVLMGVASARGAEGDSRLDVTAIAGYGSWGGMGHNISMGSGISAGGSLGYRLTRRFWVEAEYAIFRMKGHVTHYTPPTPTRPLAEYETPYRAHGGQASANILWQASEGRTRAYLLFGAGAQTFRQQEPADTYVTTAGQIAAREGSRVGPAFNVGGGFKIRLAGRVFLRPEGRLHIGGDTSGMTDLPFVQARFTVGLGYSF
jgi:hypothetical protein